jgi:hypothetical protein
LRLAIANLPGRTLAPPFAWQRHFAMSRIREPKTKTTSAEIIVRSDIRGDAGGNIDQNGLSISRIEIADPSRRSNKAFSCRIFDMIYSTTFARVCCGLIYRLPP